MPNIILTEEQDTFIGPDGRPIEMKAVGLADRLIKAKRKYQLSDSDPTKSFWLVVEEVIKVWKETRQEEFKAYLFELDEIRKSRKNKFASSTTDPYTSGTRYLVDVPEFVVLALRMLYTVDELPMGKDFWHAFAKKFPEFMVAEKF